MNNSEGQTQEPVGGMHELKIWPEYFDDVESGKKNFEVRKLDRLFGVGDTLHLREWSLIKGYSGRETKKIITYVMAGGQWGLSEGNCILGITTPPPAPIKTEGEDERNYSFKEVEYMLSKFICEHAPNHSSIESPGMYVSRHFNTPQSSTEEEKDLWNEVMTLVFPVLGKRQDVITELLTTYKISKI